MLNYMLQKYEIEKEIEKHTKEVLKKMVDEEMENIKKKKK